MVRKRRPRVGHHQFTPETRQNVQFEQYYKGQGLVVESEWPAFMHALQQELPVTFRVTGFREQNKELLRLIKHRYRNEIIKLQFPATDSGEAQQQHISFDSLSWYPNELAWQLDASRFVVRKTPELKVLHQFLVSETESGNISRQEAVSMLPPLLLDIRSHHSVLDLCAAPGSKSAQLVELLHADAETKRTVDWSYTEPTGLVVANDVDQKRCYMMVHQVKRLQSPCTVITQEDATCFPRLYVPDPSTLKTDKVEMTQFLFDRVLADVPCSGDGTLRKNPDLWLRWSPNLGIAEHYLQLRILRRGLELLRDTTSDGDHGRLVYSTCSFNPLENEAVIASMLHACQGAVRLVGPDRLACVTRRGPDASHGRFQTRPGLTSWRVMNKKGCWFDKFEDVPQSQQCNLRPSLFPPPNITELGLDRCFRVFPQDQNTGGFFLAVLEKVAPLPWMKPTGPRSYAFVGPRVSGICDQEEAEDTSNLIETDFPPEPNKETCEDECSPTIESKKPRVFNENPFTYIDPSNDKDWANIRDYYGIMEASDHDTVAPKNGVIRNFCPANLLYRSTGDELRRRQFYYTNKLVKQIIQSNLCRGIKIVNCGVRMFCIMEDKQFTGYRLLQDGVELADAFLPETGGRRIHLTSMQYSDLKLMLEEEMPLISRMTVTTQSQWNRLTPGPVLIDYSPSNTEVETEQNLPQCRLVFAGWRGIQSLRHYIGRHERLHLMRLANLDPKPAIMGHTVLDQKRPRDEASPISTEPDAYESDGDPDIMSSAS
ncbi:hypothetical protein P879_02397 [Paragonimus westermani]|uniref:tRNA (cytosine(34)-C(5))-methyltransferase n=1 Tax=Paragonimus westermani TaxID=34504 RepID=A0A8T0DF28_9TREM|nr:hypothetical protein P879_02397 [Paragonimus westermani]